MKREIQDASHLRRSMKIFGEQKSIFVGCRTQLSRLRDGKMNAKVPKFTFVHFRVARMKHAIAGPAANRRWRGEELVMTTWQILMVFGIFYELGTIALVESIARAPEGTED